MESIQRNNKILLELTTEEAIVLFEWLCHFNGTIERSFQDQAEERVLWDMEASLEKNISETFNDNYTEILSKAREKIRD